MDTTTFLTDHLTPSFTLDGVRYFNAEKVIVLAAALSDFGRDYHVQHPVEVGYQRKISTVVELAYDGKWAFSEVEDRISEILSSMPQFAYTVLTLFSRFRYTDLRDTNKERLFDINNPEFRDIPENIIGRFAAAHFSTIQRVYVNLKSKDEFVGEVKGKLNGLDLTFFNHRYFEPNGAYYNDPGTHLYYFFDTANHLVIWKTSVSVKFERGGQYTLIGGTVKTHDYYKEAKKTVITRARFFDHQTGEKFDK